MEIPLLEINIENLNGFALSNSDRIPVKGNLLLEKFYPVFKGESDFDKYGSSEIPEFSFELNDKSGRAVTCEKINVRKNNSSGEFEAILTKAIIEKGKINEDEEVEIFNITLSKKYFGPNKLTSITPTSILFNKIIPEIVNSSGFLYSKIQFKNIKEYDKQLNKFYSLLSFVTANFVAMPYQLVWKDKDNYRIEFNYSNYSEDGGGVFYLDYPNEIQNFINTAWNNWNYQIKDFNLPILLDYYVLIENQKHIEGKLLFSSIWMEAVKYDYAVNVKKYKTNSQGSFLKPGTKQPFKFIELVSQVYSHFSITDGDLSFEKYRNEVIHQGKIDLDFGNKYNQFLLLISSIEKILFRLFGYKGNYWNRITKNWEVFQ